MNEKATPREIEARIVEMEQQLSGLQDYL